VTGGQRRRQLAEPTAAGNADTDPSACCTHPSSGGGGPGATLRSGRAGRRPVRPGPIGSDDLLPNHRTSLPVFGVGPPGTPTTLPRPPAQPSATRPPGDGTVTARPEWRSRPGWPGQGGGQIARGGAARRARWRVAGLADQARVRSHTAASPATLAGPKNFDFGRMNGESELRRWRQNQAASLGAAAGAKRNGRRSRAGKAWRTARHGGPRSPAVVGEAVGQLPCHSTSSWSWIE
jgi:hypothetical protein